MPVLHSPELGPIDYREEDLILFPLGLPAFETRTRFLLIEDGAYAPLAFLLSVEQPDLRFACVPVRLMEAAYRLELQEEEEEALGLSGGESTLGLFGIITFPAGETPTVNLLAPLVINREQRLGVQSVQTASSYAVRHPLRGIEGDRA